MPHRQVIIIGVTDGYTGFLSVPVSMFLSYFFVLRSGYRAVRKDRGVSNSITTTRNLSNLIVGTDRRLLSLYQGAERLDEFVNII